MSPQSGPIFLWSLHFTHYQHNRRFSGRAQQHRDVDVSDEGWGGMLKQDITWFYLQHTPASALISKNSHLHSRARNVINAVNPPPDLLLYSLRAQSDIIQRFYFGAGGGNSTESL